MSYKHKMFSRFCELKFSVIEDFHFFEIIQKLFLLVNSKNKH